MKLGEFRKLTAHLPDDTPIMFHAYDKGCCHAPYPSDWNYIGPEGWCYIDEVHHDILMNPGDDYDDRRPQENEKK